MQFDERYQLVYLKEDTEAKFYAARELSTGRQVTVFLFVGHQAIAQADLIEQLGSLDPALFPELIETGRNQGIPYVVTLPLSGFTELKAKASKLKPAIPARPAPKRDEFSKAGVWHIPQAPQRPEDKGPVAEKTPEATDRVEPGPATPPAQGGFTHMFQPPAPPMDEPLLAPASPQIPLEQPPATTSPVDQTPGEFTRLFQSPVAPSEEPAKVAQPSVPLNSLTRPKPAAPAEPAPGEFTRLFQAAAQGGEPMGEHGFKRAPITPRKPFPSAPPHSAPGEFTRFFQSAPAPSGPVPDNQNAEGPDQFTKVFGGSAPSPAQESAGQFTRIFAAPSPQPPGTEASPRPSFAPPAGEFTQIFGGASTEIPAAAPVEPQQPAPPGEYTRMFSAQAVPPGEEPISETVTEPAPEAPVPTKQSYKTQLLLGLIIVLLVLAIAVLVVVTRK